MSKQHDYTSTIRWTGDRGQGTRTYKGYDRTWRIETPGKRPVECSNDPLLGGDPAIMGAIGMLSGFCGTLMTPMAANFNVVPANLLDLPDRKAALNETQGDIEAAMVLAIAKKTDMSAREPALLHELMSRWQNALDAAETWVTDLTTGPARRRSTSSSPSATRPPGKSARSGPASR